MTLNDFLAKITNGEFVSFEQTMAIIADNYHYHPTDFSNGLNDDTLINQAGTNEGSCKIFAFANLHQLDLNQTLNLFGNYYRLDVMTNPDGSDHKNIRNFIKYGWQGIHFEDSALSPKN
jgi:hypothetical protein